MIPKVAILMVIGGMFIAGIAREKRLRGQPKIILPERHKPFKDIEKE